MTVPPSAVDQADRHAEAGGLAGTVGAEQADDLAALDVVINAADDLAAAVPFPEAANLQQGHCSILLDRVADNCATPGDSANPFHAFDVGPEENAVIVGEPDVGSKSARPCGQYTKNALPVRSWRGTSQVLRPEESHAASSEFPSHGCPCCEDCCLPS